MPESRRNNPGSALLKYAEILKRARIFSQFTQKQVAEQIGVSITTVSHWETARKIPSDGNLEKLIVLYDIPFVDESEVELFRSFSKKQLINTLCEIMDEK